MRSDMSKVLVERPRHGWRLKTRRNRLARADDLPTKIGVRRYAEVTDTCSKYPNEHLRSLAEYSGR